MPHSIFPIARSFIVLALLLSSLTAAIAAPVRGSDTPTQGIDYIPELTPRPGERRFKLNAFKFAHNSYWRNEDLKTQIDDFNAWGIELDLWWQDGQFYVRHNADGCDEGSENLLVNWLTNMKSSTWQSRVTVLWFEMKGFCSPVATTVYEESIKQVVEQLFGWSHVYTPAEFKNPSIDNGKWPSWQELRRRDKNLIIVTDKGKLDSDNHWFFQVTYSRSDPNTITPIAGNYFWEHDIVFFNTKNIDDLPIPTSEYWASRIWPDPECGDIGGPLYENEGDWNAHVNEHPTLVTTNCLDTDWTNGRTQTSRKVHPPQPTFVVPSPTGARQLGTLHYPYQGSGRGSFDGNGGYLDGLAGAISRVSQYGSSTEIWIEAGDYETYTWEFVEFRGILINRPMVLKAINGTVVIH